MAILLQKCHVDRILALKDSRCKGSTITSTLATTVELAIFLHVSTRRILNEQRKCQSKVWARFESSLHYHSRCAWGDKYFLLFISEQNTMLGSTKFEHIVIRTEVHYKQTSLERKKRHIWKLRPHFLSLNTGNLKGHFKWITVLLFYWSFLTRQRVINMIWGKQWVLIQTGVLIIAVLYSHCSLFLKCVWMHVYIHTAILFCLFVLLNIFFCISVMLKVIFKVMRGFRQILSKEDWELWKSLKIKPFIFKMWWHSFWMEKWKAGACF